MMDRRFLIALTSASWKKLLAVVLRALSQLVQLRLHDGGVFGLRPIIKIPAQILH